MRLGDYLKAAKRRVGDFAVEIEVKPLAVYRYINGSRIPEPAVMTRIVKVTDGAVLPNDFYAVPDLPKAQAAGGTGFAT